MSKLSELIAELCPDGVEYLQVQEVVNIKPGRDYKHLQSGNIPVYGSGGIMTYVNEFSYNRPTVLLPRKGSISNIFYVDKPFWNVDTIYYTEINEAKIVPRYFYHVMCHERIEKLNTSNAARPALTRGVLNKIKIPVPPLEVQREIVRILDSFSGLTTELTEKLNAELIARKKQYEYYRDLLLTFDDAECPRGGDNDRRVAVRWMKLDQISKNLDSRRKPIKESNRIRGNYPYYGASGIVDYVNDYLFDGEYLLVSEDGANLLARNTPIAFSIQGKTWVNNHAHILEFPNYVSRRYCEIYLNSINLEKYISTAAQPKLTKENLYRIPIPVPPLSEQRRIVAILDRFDALCHDISAGLPAEIAARRKQYEYYRDKLLTFEEKTA